MSRSIAHAVWHASLALRPETRRSLAEARLMATASASQLAARQAERLQSVVRAARRAPGYRARLAAAGLDGDAPVTQEAFSRIPVLTRADVRTLGDQLCAVPVAGLFRNASGGSTGEPVTIWQDRAYTHALLGAKFFFYELMGLHYADPCVLLWGSERDILAGAESFVARTKNWLLGRHFINAFRLREPDVDAFCDLVGIGGDVWVLAYVQSIREVARAIEREPSRRVRPRAVVCSAGVLDAPTAALISRVCGCPVFNRYGSREVGDMAGSCIAGQLHTLPHMHVLELLDEQDRPVPAGEPGRVVVTSLTNHVMPLIRYDLGDLAVASTEPCACGRALPALSRIVGRQVEVLHLANGSIVDGEYFAHMFYARPYCRQFQVRQLSDRVVEILIATNDVPAVERDTDTLIRESRAALGPDVRVIVRPVSEIAATGSGKTPMITQVGH